MTPLRHDLPTLTEVIEIEAGALAPLAPQPESLPLEPPDTPQVLTTQVLECLRPRVDALLQGRLQDVIEPHLARLSDELAQRLRVELAGALQALVTQAVDEALARRREP